MDAATESNVIFIEAWDAMNRDCKGFEKLNLGHLEASWSGHPVMFLNMAVTVQPPASAQDFRRSVRNLSDWAGERKLPWMLSVCHETMGAPMGEVEKTLGEEGMAPIMPLTGMEASLLKPDGRPPAQGEWLTEASSGIGRKVLDVNEAAYQMPLGEPGSMESEQPGWWGAPERMVTLLEVDGQPASCAAVLNLAGLRYVALVATMPGLQKRGYAAMAMRDALERSLAAGMKERTYLHATAAGKPVYEKMGYAVTANYTVYLRQEFFPPEH